MISDCMAVFNSDYLTLHGTICLLAESTRLDVADARLLAMISPSVTFALMIYIHSDLAFVIF